MLSRTRNNIVVATYQQLVATTLMFLLHPVCMYLDISIQLVTTTRKYLLKLERKPSSSFITDYSGILPSKTDGKPGNRSLFIQIAVDP